MKLGSPCGMLSKSMQFDKTQLGTAMKLVLLHQPDGISLFFKCVQCLDARSEGGDDNPDPSASAHQGL